MHKLKNNTISLILLFLLLNLYTIYGHGIQWAGICHAQSTGSPAAVSEEKNNMEMARRLRAEGEELQKKGQLAAAIEKYELSRKYYPDPRLAEHIKILREALTKQYIEAAKKLRGEGEALQKQGKLEAAIEKYELSQGYYSDPKLAEYIKTLRETLTKQYVEAAKGLRAEGEALQKQGKVEAAIEKYKQAQKYYPDPKLAEHILALQKSSSKPKFELEGTPEGFKDELAAIERLQQNPGRGNIEALAELRYQYALTLTQSALKKKDEDAYKLAFLYAQSATDLAPDKADYWSLLGQLYDNLEDAALNEIMAEENPLGAT